MNVNMNNIQYWLISSMTSQEDMFANYQDAVKMIQDAEGSAKLTVKYLPLFKRVHNQKLIDEFKSQHSQIMNIFSTNYCLDRCENNSSSDCKDKCAAFYDSAMSSGLSHIAKVHKEYKLQAVEEEE